MARVWAMISHPAGRSTHPVPSGGNTGSKAKPLGAQMFHHQLDWHRLQLIQWAKIDKFKSQVIAQDLQGPARQTSSSAQTSSDAEKRKEGSCTCTAACRSRADMFSCGEQYWHTLCSTWKRPHFCSCPHWVYNWQWIHRWSLNHDHIMR